MIDEPSERARVALARARRTTSWRPPPSGTSISFTHILQAQHAALEQLLADPAAPEAASLGELIAELAEVAEELHRTVDAAGWAGVVDIHAVAARLRTASSQPQLIELAAAELRALGFERVLLSRVDGDRWIPLVVNHGSVSEQLPSAACGLHETRLDRNLAEFDLVHKRQALLVPDAARDAHVHAEFQSATRTRSYVAAPVLAGNGVAGMAHADHHPHRDVTERDSALLGVFAACLGYAVERLSLAGRLQVVLREATVDPGAVLLTAEEFFRVSSLAGSTRGGPARRHTSLTVREHEVLVLLAKGMSNSDIAAEIVVSESTVKAHVKNILRKLGATNRAEAVARFFQR